MARSRNVTIKINEETKQALLKLAGEIQAHEGESTTIDDAIRFLFEGQRPDLLKRKHKTSAKSESSDKRKSNG